MESLQCWSLLVERFLGTRRPKTKYVTIWVCSFVFVLLWALSVVLWIIFLMIWSTLCNLVQGRATQAPLHSPVHRSTVFLTAPKTQAIRNNYGCFLPFMLLVAPAICFYNPFLQACFLSSKNASLYARWLSCRLGKPYNSKCVWFLHCYTNSLFNLDIQIVSMFQTLYLDVGSILARFCKNLPY